MRWSPNRVLALYIGLGCFFLGILGLFAAPTLHEGTWTLFKLDIIVNLLHQGIGITGIVAVFTGWPRLYNCMFGIFSMLIGLIGLMPMLYFHGLLLGLTHVNLALNLVHLLAGLVAFVFGFFISAFGTWKVAVRSTL